MSSSACRTIVNGRMDKYSDQAMLFSRTCAFFNSAPDRVPSELSIGCGVVKSQTLLPSLVIQLLISFALICLPESPRQIARKKTGKARQFITKDRTRRITPLRLSLLPCCIVLTHRHFNYVLITHFYNSQYFFTHQMSDRRIFQEK